MIPQIDAKQAWQTLVDDERAVLVDVRTETEWRSIGVADLTTLGKRVRYASWTDETGAANPYFADQATDGVDPDAPILLLCRSGARSQAAAELLMASGFNGVHNITGGFEGPRGPNGHSGGWKDQLGGTDYHPST